MLSVAATPHGHFYNSIVNYDIEVNTLRPRQNGHHFADDIFKCIFIYEKFCILLWISMKFVPKGSFNNIPALVQIMAWRRAGDKPLSEPMMVSLLTHICVTRPPWVNNKKTIKLCMDSPHKWPVMQKVFPWHDIIMCTISPRPSYESAYSLLMSFITWVLLS